MNCGRCGAQAGTESLFCASCGHDLHGINPPVEDLNQVSSGAREREIAAEAARSFSQDDRSIAGRAKPPSVRGWLLFFCIALTVLSPLMNLSEASNSSQLFPKVFAIVFAIFEVFVGVSVWRVSPKAFRNLRLYFGVLLCSGLLSLIAGLYFNLRSTPTRANVGHHLLLAGVGTLLGCATWWLYFNRSKRVRETFGRNI